MWVKLIYAYLVVKKREWLDFERNRTEIEVYKLILLLMGFSNSFHFNLTLVFIPVFLLHFFPLPTTGCNFNPFSISISVTMALIVDVLIIASK